MTPRLLPDEPLPEVAYIPGQTARPAEGEESPPPLDPANWAASRAYLRGLDLFNHGFVWEAHEAWEGVWHAAGRKGPIADFLKGLIHLAAAGVKHRQEQPRGVKSHGTRAAVLFRATVPDGEGRYLGLVVAGLVAVAERMAERGWPEGLVLVPVG